jgi:hypothetical protein
MSSSSAKRICVACWPDSSRTIIEHGPIWRWPRMPRIPGRLTRRKSGTSSPSPRSAASITDMSGAPRKTHDRVLAKDRCRGPCRLHPCHRCRAARGFRTGQVATRGQAAWDAPDERETLIVVGRPTQGKYPADPRLRGRPRLPQRHAPGHFCASCGAWRAADDCGEFAQRGFVMRLYERRTFKHLCKIRRGAVHTVRSRRRLETMGGGLLVQSSQHRHRCTGAESEAASKELQTRAEPTRAVRV